MRSGRGLPVGFINRMRSRFNRQLSIAFHDAEYVYDGTSHELSYDVQGLPAGYRIEVRGATVPPDATGSIVELTPTNVTVFSKQGRDVTKRFVLVFKPARVCVKPAPLVISSGSARKEWDGVPLVCNSVTAKGLVNGEALEVRSVGSLSDEGSALNTIQVDWDCPASTAKRSNYKARFVPGTLTIDKARFEVSCRLVEVQYDGRPHRFAVDAPDGAQVIFLDGEEHRDAGSYTSRFVVTLPHRVDVCGVAQMIIMPAELTIQAGSFSKEYDGEPLTCESLTIIGLVEGESLDVRAVGSIVEVGRAANDVVIDWALSDARESNYAVTVKAGELLVTAAPIQGIRASDIHAVYNGKPHAIDIDVPEGAQLSLMGASEYVGPCNETVKFCVSMPNHQEYEGSVGVCIDDACTPVLVSACGGTFTYDGCIHGAGVEVTGVPEGYRLVRAQSNAEVRTVADGVVTAVCDELLIEDAEGLDATGRLNVVYGEPAQLSVVPAPLTIKTGSACKAWDGVALSYDDVVIEGLAEGETLVVNVLGTLTDAGSVQNEATVDWGASIARPENYDVRFELGTLTIEKAPLIVTGRTVEAKYDGRPHRFEIDAPEDATIEFGGVAEHRNAGSYAVQFTASMPNHEDAKGVAELRILPAPLRVTAGSRTKEYDGQLLTEPLVNIEGLAEGETLVSYAVGSVIDVGSARNEAYIDWESSLADENNYDVVLEDGTLVVNPAEITGIEVMDAEVIYDGKHHGPHIRIPEGAHLSFAGESEFIGPCSRSIQFTVTMPQHRPYKGVAPLHIVDPTESVVVNVIGGTFVYDGQPHEATIEILGIPEGYHLVVAQSAPSVRNVADGVAMAYCKKLKIEDQFGRDATKRLNVVYGDPAPISIEPALLTVTSGSAGKVWDGLPLTCDELDISGLVEGESLVVRACGSVVDVGSGANQIEVDWNASTAQCGNYRLTLVPGTLTVEPVPINITGKELEVVYDGSPYAYEVDAPEGTTIVFEDNESHASVGTYKTRFTASLQNGAVAEGEAILRIIDSPEPIVVKTMGGEFKYDGKPHIATVEAPTLPEGYNLVEAHSIASVKDVDDGLVAATCDVLHIVNREGEDVTDRLNVVYDDATLRVTPRKLLVVTHDAKRAYNGKPLRADGVVRCLVAGETVTLTVTGSQTEIGESTNTYELIFDGTAKRSNYVVGETLGTLRVTASAAVAPESIPATPSSPRKSPSTTSTATQSPEQRMPKKAVPIPDSAVPWSMPVIRSRSVAGDGVRGARHTREYHARPVDMRPALEESGYGRDFRPYAIDVHPLADHSLERRLHGLDLRAHDAIDDVLDRNPQGLLFECFGAFSADSERLKQAFGELFKATSSPKYALAWIDRNCRDAFLVYVAVLAHELYDGDSLWDNLFNAIGIREQDACYKFRRMFIAYLYQRNMVVYESNQEHTYMLNSAVLHGGFSAAVWRDLWKNCFLPLAHAEHAPKSDVVGAQILERIMEPGGAFRPRNRKVAELIERAPRESVAALCAMAWKVAVQVVNREKRGETETLISPCGLSDAAMSALRGILAGAVSSGRSKQLMYLNNVSLVFDKATGVVRFTWQDDSLPSSMANARIDYYVNGVFRKSQVFERRSGSCILRGDSIELEPCARYDIERRVMVKGAHDNDGFREAGSLVQSFQNSKPGCYEFILDPRGTYRFRSPEERLTKSKTRVAYLVEAGKRIDAQRGMQLIDSIAGCDSWSGMTIYEFDVAPGAAGVIYDLERNEIATAWSEDYRVHIEKSRAIGVAGGLDLYGHMLGMGETDVALPSISIDALGGHALGDVEVRFMRDGKQAELESHWDCSSAEGVAMLTLSFPSNDAARGIAEHCVIEARQKSTGDTLLRYRFAIVPIQGFRLVDYKFRPSDEELIGIYQYEVTEALTIKYNDNDGIEEHPETGVQSNLERPLRDDIVRVTMIDSQGRSLDVGLYLAGVEISVSQALLDARDKSAFIGLPTRRKLSYIDGDITILTKSPRRGRTVDVKLGTHRLASKTLDRAGDTKVNIFENESYFKPQAGQVCQLMPLVVRITYGFYFEDGHYKEAAAPCEFLTCGRGFEFTDCTIRLAVDGRRQSYVLHFKGKRGCEAPPCPLLVTFKDEHSHDLGTLDVQAGQSSVVLPDAVRRAYEERKVVNAHLVMKGVGLFGRLETENPMDLTFQRGNPHANKKG